MARRRKSVTPTLFPFLSVLFCSIGVMIMVITGQNLVAFGETGNQYLEIGGGKDEKEAVYVECQEKKIIIHPERTEVLLKDLKQEMLDNELKNPGFLFGGPRKKGSTEFHRLVDKLQGEWDQKTLVLLVRPEGVEAYDWCSQLALIRKIRWGKDALFSKGRVVLTKDGKTVVKKTKGSK